MGLVSIDCREMTVDEQLALASAISDGLMGKGVALVKDDRLVIDPLSNKVAVGEVLKIVKDFISRRKDSQLYSVEVDGQDVLIHAPDPLSRSRGRKDRGRCSPRIC